MTISMYGAEPEPDIPTWIEIGFLKRNNQRLSNDQINDLTALLDVAIREDARSDMKDGIVAIREIEPEEYLGFNDDWWSAWISYDSSTGFMTVLIEVWGTP
jgi:hypothetical protein